MVQSCLQARPGRGSKADSASLSQNDFSKEVIRSSGHTWPRSAWPSAGLEADLWWCTAFGPNYLIVWPRATNSNLWPLKPLIWHLDFKLESGVEVLKWQLVVMEETYNDKWNRWSFLFMVLVPSFLGLYWNLSSDRFFYWCQTKWP